MPFRPFFSSKELSTVGVRSIPVNLWDDYYDDGHVPKGEIQETHAYVETDVLSRELKEDVLRMLVDVMKKLNPSKKARFALKPRRDGVKEIAIQHLTHADRIALLRKLQKAKLAYEGARLSLYSES